MEFQRRQLIGSGILAAALFSVWAFAIPGIQEVRTYRAAITEREGILNNRQALIATAADLYQQYQERVTDVQKFSAVVPVSRGSAELVSAIEQISQQSGVQIQKMGLSDGKEEGKEGSVAISMEGSGSYPSLMVFLGGFEKNVRLVDIEELKVNRDQASQTTLTFSIKATAYMITIK